MITSRNLKRKTMKRGFGAISCAGSHLELDKNSTTFTYLKEIIHRFSSNRIKEGILFKEIDNDCITTEGPIFIIKLKLSKNDRIKNLSPVVLNCSVDLMINNKLLKQGETKIIQHFDMIMVSGSNVSFHFIDYRESYRLPKQLSERFYSPRKFDSGVSDSVFFVYETDAPHQKYVLKKATKKQMEISYDLLAKEADIISKLDHPNIVKLLDYYDYSYDTYMIIEYLECESLINVLQKEPDYRIAEESAKLCFYQVTQGLRYLHDKHIAHRDIKCDNVFARMIKGRILCKIGDFGLSTEGDDSLNECGTLHFASPEIIQQRQSAAGSAEKADMWAMGVLLHCILSGKYPFYGDNDSIVRGQIRSAVLKFEKTEIWDKISNNAKGLIEALINPDPRARFSTEEVLKHPWFSDSQFEKELAAFEKSLNPNEMDKDEEVQDENKKANQQRVKVSAGSSKKQKAPFGIPKPLTNIRQRAI